VPVEAPKRSPEGYEPPSKCRSPHNNDVSKVWTENLTNPLFSAEVHIVYLLLYVAHFWEYLSRLLISPKRQSNKVQDTVLIA